MPTLLGLIPDPSWLNPGDNAWQLTSATLVGLMSVPGLAVLYGGVVQKRWAVNSAMMAFYAFAMVLIVWVLWGFKAGFGSPWQGLGTGSGFLSNFIGVPGPVLDHVSEQARAGIPLLSGTGAMPQFRFPQSSLIYFQFVFAAITPILILGSVIGRINFKAWMLFVPLWSGLVYSVNAFLLWGGGWWAQQGAVDYSGGYVIHLAAGVSGFVAAAVVGPRLLRDRRSADPNNLLMVMAGAGLLWLGWNGFNGGDPYFSNADASAAVLNTNLAAATAMLTWMMMDVIFSGKPSITGAVNGMITGLVAITPAAGFVNGVGAILIGVAASSIPWVTMNVLGRRGVFKRVDDALGVVHTHGFAGLIGGLMVGLIADPRMVVYLGAGKESPFAVGGLYFTGNGHQFWIQLGAAATIIGFDGLMTFAIMKLIGLIVPLRLPDAVLETGDLAIHGEELGYTPPHPLHLPGHPVHAPSGSSAPAAATALFGANAPAEP
jgi:Amt family ammonium transporter